MIESKIVYTVFYDQEQETQEADIEYFLRRPLRSSTDMSDRAEPDHPSCPRLSFQTSMGTR